MFQGQRVSCNSAAASCSFWKREEKILRLIVPRTGVTNGRAWTKYVIFIEEAEEEENAVVLQVVL